MSVSLLNDISRNVQNIDLYERHVVRRIFLDFLILYCFCIFFEILYFCILFLLVFQILYFVFFFKKYLQRNDFENFFKKIREDVLAPQELGFACQFVELNSQTFLLEGL